MELVDLQKRLQQAEHLAAVGRMSAQVAHEVGNPLHSIGLESEFALEVLESIKTDKTNKWIHLIDTKRFIQNDLGIETIPRKILVNDKLEIIGVYTSNFYGKYNLENDLEKYKITN